MRENSKKKKEIVNFYKHLKIFPEMREKIEKYKRA